MWRGRCRLRARWASLLACLLCAATARAQDITWTDNGDGTHVIDDSFGFDATEYSFVSKFTRGESVALSEADRFGAEVSIDGDTLAVGRPHHFDNQEYRGEVWMYARDTPGNRTSSWSLIQIVRAPDGRDGDYFAGSLDLDGDTLVVGAAQASPHGVEDDAGSAYVFTRSTAGVPSSLWTFRQKLQSPTRLEGDNFGFAVAVDGDVVIAGAPKRDQSADGNQVVDSSMSGQNIGAVFVFARATPGDRTSEFVLLDRLENPYPRDDDRFGATVAVDGDVLVATTAAEMTFNRGNASQFCPIAYVFVRTEPGVTHSRWADKAFLKLDECDTVTEHLKPVAVYGDVIVVGAPDHDHVEEDSDGGSSTHDEAGHAYVFTRDLGGDVNGNWNLAETLNAEVFSAGDNFGWSVGVWNETIAVGAPFKDEHETWNEGVARNSTGDENHGAVYLFQQSNSDNSDGSTSLTWVMVVRFVPSGDDTNGGGFGASLAVHRDGLAVGAENVDGVAGAAYVFALPEVIDPTPAAPTTNATNATANATNATAPVGSLGPAPGSKNKDDAIGVTNVRFMASTIASFVLAAPFSFLAVCAIFFKPWLRRKLLDCGWKNLADTIVPDWKSDVRLMKIEVSKLQAHVKEQSFPRKKDVRPILMANELKMKQPGDAPVTSRSKTGTTTMGLLAGETVAVNSMFPGGAAMGVPKNVASAMAKEVKELATLNHPNLRMVKGAVPEKGIVVMEHCRGGSVRDRMGDEESGGMSAYDITAVAVGAAHGLAYLEREKIVHGDLSADSIHLDEKGAAKIGDFGFQDTKKNIEKANASSFWFAKRAVANQNQVTPEPTNPAELSSDPRADAAATSIQAAYRGAVARKTVAVMRDPAAQAAATTIQAAHRGAQARKDVAKMRDARGDGGGPVSESFVSSGYGARDADRVHSNGRSRRMHADARDARDATKTLSEGEGERNLLEAAVAGAVRWAGFGLGRVAPAAAASNRAGAVCEGKEAKNEEEEAEKAAWMAPELLRKGKKAKKTPASDVYALGMTLWQLYERRKPYGDATAYEIKVRVLGGERPEFKNSSVPFKIKGIVECCLKEKPKTRPAATEVSFMIQEAAKEMKKPATKLVDKGIVKHEKKFM